MRFTVSLFLVLGARSVMSQIDVCSLPSSALYIPDGNSFVACTISGSSTLSPQCQTACRCRRLELAQKPYGVCLQRSTHLECDMESNATTCTRVIRSVDTTVIVKRKLASNENDKGGGLNAWQWTLIGLAIAFVIAFVIGLIIFLINWFKHRPQLGDNRREVVQAIELSRSQPKDDDDMPPYALRESQSNTILSNHDSVTRSTRSRETNPSQLSNYSGGSYRTYHGNHMSSTINDTDSVAPHQERVFSPISDSTLSVCSSNQSQGVDSCKTPRMQNLESTIAQENNNSVSSDSNRNSQGYPSVSSYSVYNDMDSFSSELTVEDSETDTEHQLSGSTSFSQNKSIEF